jgi:tetratricopeptide (TPR) repeat protein
MLIYSKFVRWIIYLILALVVVWFIERIFDYFYIYESTKKSQESEKMFRECNEQYTSDSLYKIQFDSLSKLKQYDKLIDMMEKRILIYPFLKSDLTNDIGVMYFNKGDTNMAILKYSEVINSGKHFPLEYCNRAELYLDKNEYDLAIKDYKSAAEINWDYYFELGVAQERKGAFEDAKASFTTFLNHKPNKKDSLECKSQLDSLEIKMKGKK